MQNTKYPAHMSNPSYSAIHKAQVARGLQVLIFKILGYELQPISTLSFQYKRGRHSFIITSYGRVFSHYE